MPQQLDRTMNSQQKQFSDTIMIIRHAEKPIKDQIQGVTKDGVPDKESLIVRGWQRAGALAAYFDPTSTSTRAATSTLPVPTSLYATHPGSGSHRPLQTITPLSEKLNLRVNTDYGNGDEEALGVAISHAGGTVLVAWHHETLPEIPQYLGLPVTPTPPTTWPDQQFDMVWVFTSTGSEWKFAQVPQALLSGDTQVAREQPELATVG
jgi:hypothetical protein